MKLMAFGFSLLMFLAASTGCSTGQNASTAIDSCDKVSVSAIAQDPRPWIGKTICTTGSLYMNDDYHSYLYLQSSEGNSMPAGVTIFLESFKEKSTEGVLRNQRQGATIEIVAKLSIFEDCWEAEERGEIEDPCLPSRRPIFLDNVELLSLK